MNEFDDSRDKKVSDIIAYYEDKPDISPDTGISVDPACANNENTSSAPPLSGNIKKPDATEQRKPVLLNELIPKKRLPRSVWAQLAGVIVVFCAFCIGRFVIPVSDMRVSGHTARLTQTDKAYLSAKTENARLGAEVSELEANDRSIETTFNDVIEYKKMYDALKSEYAEKSGKLTELDNETASQTRELDQLSAKLKEYKERSYILDAGIYTVGVHIPDGSYRVSGMGTFLLASKNRALKENERLNIPGAVFNLSDGDIIKLDNETRFEREGD